jgi:DNA-binding GntR family transcriptional regulator
MSQSASTLDDSGLAPVARDTVQDRIYAGLGDALICGRLRGGQTLTIRDLAARFDTSAMPVREALRRLIAEGALEAMPQRSVRVPPVSLERLRDLRDARLLVEGHAAQRAAERADSALIARLQRADAEFTAAEHSGEIDSELLANQRFHFAVYEAAGSPSLMQIIRSLWLQSGPCLRLAIEHYQDRRLTRNHFHRAVIRALRARDPAAASAAIRQDLSRAFELLERAQQAQGAAVRPARASRSTARAT